MRGVKHEYFPCFFHVAVYSVLPKSERFFSLQKSEEAGVQAIRI